MASRGQDANAPGPTRATLVWARSSAPMPQRPNADCPIAVSVAGSSTSSRPAHPMNAQAPIVPRRVPERSARARRAQPLKAIFLIARSDAGNTTHRMCFASRCFWVRPRVASCAQSRTDAAPCLMTSVVAQAATAGVAVGTAGASEGSGASCGCGVRWSSWLCARGCAGFFTLGAASTWPGVGCVCCGGKLRRRFSSASRTRDLLPLRTLPGWWRRGDDATSMTCVTPVRALLLARDMFGAGYL